MRFIFLSAVLINIGLAVLLVGSGKLGKLFPPSTSGYIELTAPQGSKALSDAGRAASVRKSCVLFRSLKNVKEASQLKFLLDDFNINGFIERTPASELYLVIADDNANTYLLNKKAIDQNIRLNFPGVSTGEKHSASRC